MNKIEVCSKVREYPDKGGPYNTLTIANHWNDRNKVVLELNGVCYVFIADHLKQAIQNAQNAH